MGNQQQQQGYGQPPQRRGGPAPSSQQQHAQGRQQYARIPPKPPTETSKAMNEIMQAKKALMEEMRAYTVRIQEETKAVSYYLGVRDSITAKRHLRNKMVYNQTLQSIQSRVQALDSQLEQIESAQRNIMTFNAITRGNSIVQKITQETKIEKIGNAEDDIAETKDDMNEMNKAFNDMFESQSTLNDADVDAELERMMELQEHGGTVATYDLTVPPVNTNEVSYEAKQTHSFYELDRLVVPSKPLHKTPLTPTKMAYAGQAVQTNDQLVSRLNAIQWDAFSNKSTPK